MMCIHQRIQLGLVLAGHLAWLAFGPICVLIKDGLIPIVVVGNIIISLIILIIIVIIIVILMNLPSHCHDPIVMHAHPHNAQWTPGAAGDAA